MVSPRFLVGAGTLWGRIPVVLVLLVAAACAADPMPMGDPSTAGASATVVTDEAAARSVCGQRQARDAAGAITAEKVTSIIGHRVWACRVDAAGKVLEVTDEAFLEHMPDEKIPSLVPGAPVPSGCHELTESLFVVESSTALTRARLVQCTQA